MRNSTRQEAIASRVVVADSPWSRMKGLLGRKSLGQDEALVISDCQSVHMMFMSFPIDVIFINRQKRVVGLCRDLQPFQFSPVFWKSACAIEVPAGTIVRTYTQLGDQIEY